MLRALHAPTILPEHRLIEHSMLIRFDNRVSRNTGAHKTTDISTTRNGIDHAGRITNKEAVLFLQEAGNFYRDNAALFIDNLSSTEVGSLFNELVKKFPKGLTF